MTPPRWIARLAALAMIAGVASCGDELDHLSCAELTERWRTAAFQSLRICGGTGDCAAVGQVGEACECAVATGFGAVNRDSYVELDGPATLRALASRCRDDEAVGWECEVPQIAAECRANRCELVYDGACAR